MKLTKIAGTVLFSSILLTGGTTSFAAVAGNMNSQTDVTFIEDNESVPPVNPTDPTDPVEPVDPTDPTDPHEPGTPGPLSIDYVSNFHFGEQKLTGGDKTYYAKLDKVKKVPSGEIIDVPNYVQVTDNRGTNAGWKLKVKQNGQFKTNTNVELENAQLKLSNPVVNSLTNMTYAPSAFNVTLDPSGIEHDVTTAAADKGMGTWTTAYGGDNLQGAESVSLFVPGSSKKEKEKYSTTLTWILEDTPS
ncbi:WxL domain-containing protein [Sporosarcina sp. FSL K6-1522]|uniref:WxL domain-containing protein n=1 Tax=Sporosarcina sp. FSL K6-1522 TaxID=2921554 RepID=UPI00315A6206